MYRVSPFTYLVSSVLSVGLAKTGVQCSDIELLRMPPPAGQTCGEYLGDYAKGTQATLVDANATDMCSLCQMSWTDQFLASLSIDYDDRWRNVGLLFVYVVFNAFAAVFLYWLIRMPKKKSHKKKKE